MIFYPKLTAKAPYRRRLEAFKGYDCRTRMGNGGFCQMENLTSDDYPVLSPRGKRGLVRKLTYNCRGMFYVPEKGLFYLDHVGSSCDLYLLSPEGISTRVGSLNPNPKRFALLGKTLVIVPDLRWVDVDTLAMGRMAESVELKEGVVSVSLCLADGTLLEKGYSAPNPPESPEEYSHWIDNSTHPNQVKRYVADRQEWITIDTAYVCLKGDGLVNHPFREGDGIHISGLGDTNSYVAALNGCHTVVLRPTPDTIIIRGVMKGKFSNYCNVSPVQIERKVPPMDFIVECGNRLWGCARSTNEIYACKLGDLKNWNCFQGVSTDSWVGNVGTPGEFTGAVVQSGHPIFYKETCKHKVWPSATGAHQITSMPCDGVQKGCENSLAVREGTVFYQSPGGVRADDGGGPVDIGQCLGDCLCKSAAGGVFGQKYYLSRKDGNGNSDLLVYDLSKGLWHREDGADVGHFAAGGGRLYADLDKSIWDLTGSIGTPEPDVSWMAVTGDLGLELPEQKYITRLTLRLCLEPGATLEVYAQYDRDPAWVKLGQVYGMDLRSFSLPVRPRRCDQLRLKLQGTGVCKLYSITETLEKGSELS